MDLKEINTKDLGCEYINPSDEELVKAFAKELKLDYTICLIWIYVLLFSSSIFIGSKFMKSGLTTQSFCSLLISLLMPILLIFLLFHTLKVKKSLKISTPIKAQYGKLKAKYTKVRRYDDGDRITYYMNVTFENNNTIMKNIETSRKIYPKVSLGDKILVISFDGKKAYAIKCNSN